MSLLTCLLPFFFFLSHHNGRFEHQKTGRVLDLGRGRQISDKRRMAHNKNTDGVSVFGRLDTIQNAKLVTHATGGSRLYQWDGTCIFFCVLNRKKKPCLTPAATSQPSFYPQSCFFFLFKIVGGNLNTLMHSCCFCKRTSKTDWQCNVCFCF